MSVYFIKAVDSDRVKIGFTSRAPKKRLQQIKTGCPDELKIVHLIPDGTKEDEKSFHAKFKDSRIRREWFRYHPQVAEFLGDYSLPIVSRESFDYESLGLEDDIEIAKMALFEKHEAKIYTADRYWMLWYMLQTAAYEGPDSVMSFFSQAGSDVSLGRELTEEDRNFLAMKRRGRARTVKHASR